jgi:hypothetical protein
LAAIVVRGSVAQAWFDGRQVSDLPDPLPWPESLCHRCAAPPKYVRTKSSVFIHCPLLPQKYPPQPVRQCPLFVAAEPGNR